MNTARMDPSALDGRPRLPSIFTVYQPIEDYWNTYGPVERLGADPEQVLDSLDAFLIHMVLEMTPAPAVFVDRTAASTAGACALLALNHPHVRRAVIDLAGDEKCPDPSLDGLREYLAFQNAPTVPFEITPAADLRRSISGRVPVVVLYDARAIDSDRLLSGIAQDLEAQPDALVLILGLGAVGECPALGAVLGSCSSGSGKRLRLLREAAEVLVPSQVGLVTRTEQPYAGQVFDRINGLYTGNYSFVDLLRQAELPEPAVPSNDSARNGRRWPSVTQNRLTRRMSTWVLQSARRAIRKNPAVQKLMREIKSSGARIQ